MFLNESLVLGLMYHMILHRRKLALNNLWLLLLLLLLWQFLLFHSSLIWSTLSFRRILSSIIASCNWPTFISMGIIIHDELLLILGIRLLLKFLLNSLFYINLVSSHHKVLRGRLVLIRGKLLFRLWSFWMSTWWYQVFICTTILVHMLL